MRPFKTTLPLYALAALLDRSSAGYVLKDDYSAGNFFNMFNFFTGNDPTHGYVDYISQNEAQSSGLINNNNGQIYVGVDYQNVAWGRGRKSVRLESKAAYTHGLIILDLAHMPGGICGTWPAFWTLGPSWPNGGEIDIIEGVNSQSHNSMTLHTSDGCSMSSAPSRMAARSDVSINGGNLFSGSMSYSNCYVHAPGQPDNAGCQINSGGGNTYGTGFNAAQGGVFATEWTSTFIRGWYFPRGSAPADINSANPNPNSWGLPTAYFGNNGCNIDAKFQNHNLIFDNTFCGDWAGAVWSSDATCASKAPSCQAFVQNNPGAFRDAYWAINSLKVYSSNGAMAVQDFSVASNVTEGVNTTEQVDTSEIESVRAHMHRHIARHKNKHW